MEGFIVVILYLAQISILAGMPALLVAFLTKKRALPLWSKRCMLAYGISLLLFCGSLAYLAYHPLVICPPALQAGLTDERKEEAIALNRGLYSTKAPVFPVWIRIQEITDGGEVFVETQYWFLGGTTQMVFGGSDAPSLIKELS